MNYFITGTDTDCGKTFVTALLVRSARRAGVDAVGAKPFCCGSREDVEILHGACEGAEGVEDLNPVWRSTPAAPRACEFLGEAGVDESAAAGAMKALAARHRMVLCEGAGGWLVPVRKGRTIADFAAGLGWPVVVVARNRLGVINHTLLTVDSVRQRGLELAGVILNDTVAGALDPAVVTNRAILEEFLEVPLLAEVQRGASEIAWPHGLAV